jgi:hypothetical protein
MGMKVTSVNWDWVLTEIEFSIVHSVGNVVFGGHLSVGIYDSFASLDISEEIVL